jgi:Tfp pilus assembly protein FimT
MHNSIQTQTLRRRELGVSLLDLLIATSLFFILTAIAVPSFSHLLKKNQQKETLYSIKQLLNYGRQEAVDRRETVVVCSSADEMNCSSDWEHPFIVFVDKNRNNRLDEDETLLRSLDLLQPLQSLSWRSSLNKPFVHFDENGSTRYQSGRIYYCDLSSDTNNYKAQLIVYRTGRVRIAPEAELRNRCG